VTSPAGFGLDTSSGMLGVYKGVLRSWLRLPWVPLLGAGFKPRRSEKIMDAKDLMCLCACKALNNQVLLELPSMQLLWY